MWLSPEHLDPRNQKPSWEAVVSRCISVGMQVRCDGIRGVAQPLPLSRVPCSSTDMGLSKRAYLPYILDLDKISLCCCYMVSAPACSKHGGSGALFGKVVWALRHEPKWRKQIDIVLHAVNNGSRGQQTVGRKSNATASALLFPLPSQAETFSFKHVLESTSKLFCQQHVGHSSTDINLFRDDYRLGGDR